MSQDIEEHGRLGADGLIGRRLERLEDAALLMGAGRFADDIPVRADTGHAAILRSPHAHAEVRAIETETAEALDGVFAVLTGSDVEAWGAPFLVGVRAPMRHWPLAIDRVRYVGEPVAVVVARDRYVAEDALDLITVEYRPLPAVVAPEDATKKNAPLLHPELDGNVVHDRRFRYGDPDAAFAAADHVLTVDANYPRSSCTPMETFAVVAEYQATEDAYDVMSNFMGPLTLQPVMARALKVPSNRLRLRTPPDSGGSFGVKQGVFPYAVLMCLAARKAGRPVKWVEDRLEHLVAGNSATNRVSRHEAAVSEDGVVTALRITQLEDCGAYLRAPEPATLYRMHGNLTGAYAIQHLDVHNQVVLTNKAPTGLNRGFGGPQAYFGLERLMQRIAVTLGLEPLEVIRRNLVPDGAMPYRTASGATLDSGTFLATVAHSVSRADLEGLYRRRDAARAEGRLYGIGFAAIVEPSISNMGYITTLLTPEERAKAGPKNGAVTHATVSIDPSGAVSVTADSLPQGQGHRTVLAQVVGEALGLRAQDITVIADHDTAKDAWSIAAGNYSSRFAGAVAGTAWLAAQRLRKRLAKTAAPLLNMPPERLAFAEGRIQADDNTDNAIPFRRLAGLAHWSPGSVPDAVGAGLRETAIWTMPELTPPDAGDGINSSGCHGFVFDFCGVEVDRITGAVHIDKYVTTHDAGRLLNPALVDGQVHGGFAHAVGATLYEELAYGPDGGFLAGTFADYLVPTACEVPEPVIVHVENPSPVTPLGAKGVGEGNCMSTPCCLANAVADALGVERVDPPLTPDRLLRLIDTEDEPAPSQTRPNAAENSSLAAEATAEGDAGALKGAGNVTIEAPPKDVWKALLDAGAMARLIPGCDHLKPVGDHDYRARVRLGVGPVRGNFDVAITLSDLDEPHSLRLQGSATGPLGASRGGGLVTLSPEGNGTRLSYTYSVQLSGKVAAVGGRMLEGAARALIGQFLKRLGGSLSGGASSASDGAASGGWLARLLRQLGLSS